MSLLLFPLSVFASDDGQTEMVSLDGIKDSDAQTHSEAPINIDVSNDWMHIIVNEEVERVSIEIYGPGASAEYDIDYAMPGEIYEYDISDCPCGHYYITVDADGKTYNGNIQL